MGMMLETRSRRLFETKGEAHYGSPDKDPAMRLRVLEDAGRLSVSFTSGLLAGIGETVAERAETIFALRANARRYGALQEVIVQNFRAKPDTAMRHADDLALDDYRAALAVTRIVMGPKMRIRAPPNLVDSSEGSVECSLLLTAGVDDWGGISPLTPDHVNPERPWPSLERLRAITGSCGFELRPRLTVHPEYVVTGEPWLDPRVSAHVAALADDSGPYIGLAREGVRPTGLPWQEPDGGFAGVRIGTAQRVPIVTMPRFTLDSFLHAIQEHRITHAFLVPPIAIALLAEPNLQRYDLSSLESVMCAAASLSTTAAEQLQDRLNAVVVQAYGLSEASPCTHAIPPSRLDIERGSIGPLIPNVEARLVDPSTGTDAACGHPGELWCRGPNVMAGYLDNPQATADALDDARWLPTGDIAVVDQDGTFKIVGRLKELIK